MSEVNPGEGWRLLEKNPPAETVLGGQDEYWDGNRWNTTIRNHQGVQALDTWYRRRIDDGWIRLSERLPSEAPCWMLFKNGPFRVHLCHRFYGGTYYCIGLANYPASDFEAWQPIIAPDPPKPEVSEEERAFEAWAASEASAVPENDLARAAWLARGEWEKAKQ